MERFKLIVSSYLILIKDNQILLSRRFQTGYEDGNYSLPAGHLEAGESAIECLIREAKEEISIDIKSQDVELVHTMHRQEDDIRLDLFFTTKDYQGEIRNAEPEKCDDLSWFSLDDLPGNMVPYVKQAVEKFKVGASYSQIGW